MGEGISQKDVGASVNWENRHDRTLVEDSIRTPAMTRARKQIAQMLSSAGLREITELTGLDRGPNITAEQGLKLS